MKRGLVVRGTILVGATLGIALTSVAGNAAYAERSSSGEEKDIPRAFRVLDSALTSPAWRFLILSSRASRAMQGMTGGSDP